MGNAEIKEVNPAQVGELERRQLDIIMDRVSRLVRAAQALAVPEWFDDGIAIRLLEEAGCNGRALRTLSALKSLPFIHRHEDGWVYEDAARGYFISQLLNDDGSRTEQFKTLSSSVATYLGDQRQHNLKADEKNGSGLERVEAYVNRELELRSLGHLLPSSGEAAIKGILDFYQRADEKGRTSDQRAAESLCHKQQRWMDQKLELAYFEGRYQYSRYDVTRMAARGNAEPYFWYVYDCWKDFESSKDVEERNVEREEHHRQLVAPVTHFLGIIVRNLYRPVDWNLAENLLRESIKLNQDLHFDRHEGEVRFTLGLLYLKWGRIKEARQQLARSKAIFVSLEDGYNESQVDKVLSRLDERKEEKLEQRAHKGRSIWGILSARIIGRYPGEPLLVGKEYRLEARLRRSAVGKAGIFRLTIYGSSIRTEPNWVQQLHLDESLYSQSVNFSFQVLRAGSSRIEIDLYHERQWLQKLSIDFEATHAQDGR